MAQLKQLISDITALGAGGVGTYTAIDEVTFSDADYISSNDNTNVTYEGLFDSATDPSSSAGHIVRWRQAQADGNVAPSSGGNASTYSAYLYQGITLIATLVSGETSNETSFLAKSYTLTAGEADAITNYADLRIRFDFSGSGGPGGSRRGVAVSWAQLELPDGITPVTLTTQEAFIGLTTETPTLTHKYTLVPSEAFIGLTSETPTLTHKYSLTANEAFIGLISDNVTLDLSVNLTAQEAFIGLSADSPTVTHKYTASAEEAFIGLTADQPTLASKYTLTVNEAAIGLSADSPVLSLSTSLTVQEAFIGLTADQPTVTHKYTLTSEEAFIGLTADQPTLSLSSSLTVQEANIGLTADQPTVTHKYTLSTNEAFIGLTADQPTLVVGATLLAPASAVIGLSSDQPTVTHKYTLSADEAFISMVSDQPTLEMPGTNLIVQEAIIGLTADGPTLTSKYGILVNDAEIRLNTESPTLTHAYVLAVDGAFIGLTSNEVYLGAVKFITMVGKFPTGSTVTISIYSLADNQLLVNSAAVTEIAATGYFKYKFEGPYAPDTEFLYIMTDGQIEQFGKITFNDNNVGISDALMDNVWDLNRRDETLQYSKVAGEQARQANLKL